MNTNTTNINTTKKYNTKELDPVHRLYLSSEHVLGNEVCEILGIHIANISNIKSDKILKVGNCPILDKTDLSITRKIRNTMLSDEVTSLKDKIPLSYFKSEYCLTDTEILNSIADDIEIISGKKFIRYSQDFLDKIKQPNNIDNLIYVCDLDELKDMQHDNIIKHYYQINSKKYLIIY